jgi:hypothetical protein
VQPWELADTLTQTTISTITLDHMEQAMFSYATRYPSTPPVILLPAVSAQLPRLHDALNRPQQLQTRRRTLILLGVLSHSGQPVAGPRPGRPSSWADTHRAVPLLTQARDQRVPIDAKGRALVTLDLAECHVVDDEPEEAARLAAYALDSVDGSMIAPIVTRAHRLLARMDRWSELSAVRELGARLAELPYG